MVCTINSQEYFRKKDRVDNAFLFIVGSISLIVGFIQYYYTESIIGFIEIVPLLFLGIVLPFYVGYIRGAVNDSNIERVRGWTYFAFGVTSYLAFFVLPREPSLIFFLAYGLLIFISIFFVYKIKNWFNSIFNTNDSLSSISAFFGTMFAGVGVLMTAEEAINIITEPTFSRFSSSLVFLFFSLIVFIIGEKMARWIGSLELSLTEELGLTEKDSLSFLNFIQLGMILLQALFAVTFKINNRNVRFFQVYSLAVLAVSIFFYGIELAKVLLQSFSLILGIIWSYLLLKYKNESFDMSQHYSDIVKRMIEE